MAERVSTTYRFKPFAPDDFPLMRRWLARPHVVEWWGDADEQFGLVSGDLAEPAMDQFIVSLDTRPFAYMQSYRLTDWNVDFGPQPDDTRGIDQFIGEPDMVGRGHGSAFIRAFVTRAHAGGAPRVVTDPDPDNARAIRAYEKAGFRREREIDTPDGRALLMVCDA